MKTPYAAPLTLTGLLIIGLFGPARLLADDTKPGVSMSAATTMTATVTKIDKKDRWLTLQMDDGSVFDVQVSTAAKNFPQIQVGDTVTAKEEETLAVAVVTAGQAAPNVSGGASVVTAPAGAMPLAVMVDTTMISGAVTDIDYDDRSITLLGPDGSSRTMQVGPAVTKFDAIQKGDNIVLTLKTVTSVEVTAPKKK